MRVDVAQTHQGRHHGRIIHRDGREDDLRLIAAEDQDQERADDQHWDDEQREIHTAENLFRSRKAAEDHGGEDGGDGSEQETRDGRPHGGGDVRDIDITVEPVLRNDAARRRQDGVPWA
jgi:hypothetical protein